jgi:lauroyl/myristoyl acyltransferase
VPIFPVFVLMEPDGRYRTVVETPIRLGLAPGSRSEPDARELSSAMERWVALLARVIRENPAQWFLFTRFWAESPSSL